MQPRSDLPPTADFAVIGGGVVGLCLALELSRRHPRARIAVIEKEPACGAHASSRNSGVLHAGFYYSADSLKARLCADGNRRMAAWCAERGLPLRRTGKLVVARNERELPGLHELLRRGQKNGVAVELVDQRQAREIEPLARTCERALWSPTTASVEPAAVMRSLAAACVERGVLLCTGTRWLSAGDSSRHGGRGIACATSRGGVTAGFWINAAGLYADRVAHAFGFGERYAIAPFKGLYLCCGAAGCGNAGAPPLRAQVYPVPDLLLPFLGAHFTVTAAGRVKIGPTALPALWREQYGRLGRGFFSGFDARELCEVARSQALLFARNERVRRHALREPLKALRGVLVAEAKKLVPSARAAQFDSWAAPGIRAQLYDRERGELVMDFVSEGDSRSLHVLNAISPAFTCAWSFAELVLDRAAI